MTGKFILLPSTRRILRLSIFALLVALFSYLFTQSALAWIFIYTITHPRCNPIISDSKLPPYQKIVLHTSDELTLRAWYYPTTNGAAIIALGGLCGSLGDNLPPVDFLVEAGYGVIQVDSRACAEHRSAVTLGMRELNDAYAALQFLLEQPQVNKVGAYGFSMGGVTAIRAAARYPEIAATLAEGGYHNLGDNMVKPGEPKSLVQNLFQHSIAASYWLQHQINPWHVSPIDDLPLIGPRPVLLIYGEHEAVSGHAYLQYKSAQPPKQLWIVPGGSHGNNYKVAPAAYRSRVLQFFDWALLDSDQ